MKTQGLQIIFIFLFILHFSVANADEPSCTNLGFELNNFDNWRAYTWVDRQNGTLTPKVVGAVNGRHTINTIQGYDAVVAGNLLKTIPDGYNTSVKLGSTALGSGGLRQSLTYTIDVTPNNAFVLYRFAVVLEDPFDTRHEKIDEPRFMVTILDESGKVISDCANYDVYGSDARIEGWQQVPNSKVFWRNWTAVGINLSNYIGKKVTIEFMSANCRRSGHFGYAYFTAECMPLYITVDYCAGDNNAILKAPAGFDSYEWINSANITMGYEQNLTVNNPSEGDTYTCKLISATGCELILTAIIYRYEPNAVFNNNLIDCNTLNNTIHFNINNAPTHGWLKYNWDFGDGTTSTETDPVHSFESVSGWIPVTLTVENPPSTCKDTYTKNIEIFNPPLINIVGDTTYCPGENVVLRSYGADHYKWKYNGEDYSTSDSVIVGAPGGFVELTGFTSNNECSTVKYKKIIEEPYWPFTATPDTFFCKGESVILIAEGAEIYRWSSEQKPDSVLSVKSDLLVKAPGTYIITGTNENGCTKTISINVTEIELPKAEFTVNPLIIDRRRNEVTCTIVQETGVNYFWNFGDDETYTITGNNPTYQYQNLPAIGIKTLTLLAVNEYGCSKSYSIQIVVEPFFPNVFTPNNDEINDLFLKGIQIQVLDRNGLIVYKGDEGWNGKLNNSGKNLPPDTYFYYATYTDFYLQPKTRKGYVTLIRIKQ